jgi:hypothetical protein
LQRTTQQVILRQHAGQPQRTHALGECQHHNGSAEHPQQTHKVVVELKHACWMPQTSLVAAARGSGRGRTVHGQQYTALLQPVGCGVPVTCSWLSIMFQMPPEAGIQTPFTTSTQGQQITKDTNTGCNHSTHEQQLCRGFPALTRGRPSAAHHPAGCNPTTALLTPQTQTPARTTAACLSSTSACCGAGLRPHCCCRRCYCHRRQSLSCKLGSALQTP